MLIGLTGYARTGKSTIADYLVTNHDFTLVSFADPIREFALAMDPIVERWPAVLSLRDVVNARGWEKAKEIPEVRRVLQRLGTDAGRAILGENVWVDAAMKKIGNIEGQMPGRIDRGSRYVFPDVRFPNEARAIKNRGGVIWRVTRPGFGPVNGHESETAMDGWQADNTIENDGSVDELHSLLNWELAAFQVGITRSS